MPLQNDPSTDQQTRPDPWADAAQRYPINAVATAHVTVVREFGVFAELEKGIEGLIHISEIPLSEEETDLRKLYAVGDALQVRILHLDASAHRLALSLK
ncbi:S1 RNA-binding domain-containing protein [Pseudomonas sp. RIT-PI-S]|uniref:S1 RNA-binding domain-containing protein n=1 Tax=Pseudomonas sp. RIT-PI-S TaxID=3035295 RepID=UPI0021D93753|nr:S1 RNA-binding domain-containing protein [Pseudomonas sp. RIT-PI-S]